MKLRKYKKKGIGYYFALMIIIICLSLFCTLFIIKYISLKAYEILYPMAVSETRKVVTTIINSACDDVFYDKKLYEIVKDEDDKIKIINYDSYEANKIINRVTYNVEKKIREFEQGNINYYGESSGIVSEIPIFVIFGNTLFNNIGPRIKLRLNLFGDIISNIETEVKHY